MSAYDPKRTFDRRRLIHLGTTSVPDDACLRCAS